MGNSNSSNSSNGSSAPPRPSGARDPSRMRKSNLQPGRKLRIILCGPKGCGKSCFKVSLSLATQDFSSDEGAILELHELPSDDEGMDKMLAELRSLPPNLSMGDFFVYLADLTDENSLTPLAHIHSKIMEVFPSHKGFVFGNKADVPEEQRPLLLRDFVKLYDLAPALKHFLVRKSSDVHTSDDDGHSLLVDMIRRILKADAMAAQEQRMGELAEGAGALHSTSASLSKLKRKD